MNICKQCNTTQLEAKRLQEFGFEDAGLCFECDHKNHLYLRNERNLYHRTCDATGEKTIAGYSPDKPYKIYKSSVWHGNSWDALDYGMDFDFNRPFFDQLLDLQLKVPRPALTNINGENSDYCNMTAGNKDCYLVFGGDQNQEVQYGTLCMYNKDSMDIDISDRNEQCYFLGDSNGCYGCEYVFDSKNCKNSYYLSDCIDSTECILSTNLVNKSYCINNKQYSKEEYEALKVKIIEHMKKTGEWGQFFPKEFSCFGYNESTAHKYYPLTKARALAEVY